MAPKEDIAVVGIGRLGSSLARALVSAGAQVTALAAHRPEDARALAEELGAEALTAAAACARGQWVFLAVPDDALPALVAGLPFRSAQRVVHCSGARPLDVLAPARVCGALAGCLHPLQTFPPPSAGPLPAGHAGEASRFAGITCGVEGDGPLHEELVALCAVLGANALSLRAVDRAAYHAAAVFASNYVVALGAAAARAFELAGLPKEQAASALSVLMRGAADNLARLPPERALTGPIARGDVETVRSHLAVLAADPRLREVYRTLGAELVQLPIALDPGARLELERLLCEDPGRPH